MKYSKTKPKRRWFRFSLRTLLIVVTLSAVPLGWVGWKIQRARREQAAVAWIKERGGFVYYLNEYPVSDPFEEAPEPSWSRKWVDKWFGVRVVKADLSQVREPLLDLTPLSDLYGIEEVWLSSKHANNLSQLARLENLKDLSIDDVPLSAFLPPPEVDLSALPVIDLSALSEIKSLRSLHLGTIQVIDWSPVARLPNLESLTLYHVRVNDWSPLARATSLDTLHLTNIQVRDWTSLANVKNLKTLSIINMSMRDLSILSGLKQIESLHLSDIQVSNLSPLSEMKNLKFLGFYYMEMDDGQLEKLHQTLPNCLIRRFVLVP